MKDLFIGRIRDIEVQRQLIRAKANLDDTLQLALENEKGAKTSEQFQKLLPHKKSFSTNASSIRVKHEPTSSVQQSRNQGNNSRGGGPTVPIHARIETNLATFVVTHFPSSTVGCVRPEKLLVLLVKRKVISPRYVKLQSAELTWCNRTSYLPIKRCNFIDANNDSEPEYGVMAVDVVQINKVELLKVEGGQPRSLSIQLRSGNSFLCYGGYR